MKRYSELTFNDLLKSNFANYLKIYWNGNVIYDDDLYFETDLDNTYHSTHTGKTGIEYVEKHYGNKKIYSVYILVVHIHHTELYIEGEN